MFISLIHTARVALWECGSIIGIVLKLCTIGIRNQERFFPLPTRLALPVPSRIEGSLLAVSLPNPPKGLALSRAEGLR